MKKLCVISLLLLLLGAAAFADDAKVMPMMVGRVYIAPTFTLVPGAYDNDGDYTSASESLKILNLAFAVEYGVIDWVTAAIQWTPGWTPWSDLGNIRGNDKINANGLADLFVGAKVQIVGEKAPVKNTMFRAAVALGVIIPLPGPDFAEEIVKLGRGEKATVQSMDNHVFAAGARAYFDWAINKSFFINLYQETLIYPLKQDLNKDGLALAMINASVSGTATGEKNYKYRLTFEIEPVYSTNIAEGITLSAGLPVNFRYLPAADVTLDGVAAGAETYYVSLTATNPAYILSVKPNVSMFFTKSPLPVEVQLRYELPFLGKNTSAKHNMTLLAKVYFAIPKK